MNYTNFYESIKEASIRLRGTIVVYDGLPYYVVTMADHMKDGIFRIYLMPTELVQKINHPDVSQYPVDHPALGEYVDKWMVDNPKACIIRKQMNSPLFNKFRPYPLGMVNAGTETYYVERQPNRKTEQGLLPSMLCETKVSAGKESRRGGTLSPYTEDFKDCVIGNYPSASECLTALNDPKIEDESAAFDRKFAFVRGPIGMIFLAYKEDVIGVMPYNDLSTIRLGRHSGHTREVVESLSLFNTITQ